MLGCRSGASLNHIPATARLHVLWSIDASAVPRSCRGASPLSHDRMALSRLTVGLGFARGGKRVG